MITTYSEGAPDTQFAFIAYSSADAISSNYFDSTESLVDKRLQRMGIRTQLIDIEELAGFGRIWDVLSDSTKSSIIIDAASPHLLGLISHGGIWSN